MDYLPTISIIMPVLNAGKYLSLCLDTIMNQDYPKDNLEIILADGGSTDNTFEIAKEYYGKLKILILNNPLVTSESGKAVGLKKAKGELILLIDSDNLLPSANWLRDMVYPLVHDDEIIGTEPIEYTYRRQDGFIDRYCALMGMNDPLVFWFGSYDRYNFISKKWTGLDVYQKYKDNYVLVTLESGNIPTIGANGCLFRRSELVNTPELLGDYLFDMDILEIITAKRGPQKFAKVKIGIIHLYCGSSIKKFIKKQHRRVSDFLYRRSIKDVLMHENFDLRKYAYAKKSSVSIIISLLGFILSCVTVAPLLFHTLIGFIRKKDFAWFAHPLLCWITLLVYSYGVLKAQFVHTEYSRKNW